MTVRAKGKKYKPRKKFHTGQPVHTNPRGRAGIDGTVHRRATSQRETVFNVMLSGKWYTLQKLEQLTGYPQASISSRLRDFRKKEFGGHTVKRRNLGNGLYEYKLKERNSEANA